ncbi:MAG: trypsin-like peptidase domain-containing protein [Clostridia bacterium]|nr:trypsin-like peptidase domain-containing protein [Clostridia bacterium]
MEEQKSVQNDQKIYVEKKKSGIPQVLVVLVVAVLASFISTAITYVLLKSSGVGEGTESITKKIEITKTDSPVVAIAEKAMPSIVGIKVNSLVQSTFGGIHEASSEGSGIIYSEDGYIITNYHVIESAINNSSASVYVTFYNSEEDIEAEIVGGDEVTDLAVLKIEKDGLIAAEFGNSSDLKVGELAVAIGNPLGEEFASTVTVGYVSALNRKVTTDGRTYKLIQTDAAINSGNSGGALVNSEGKVIGINSVKVSLTGVEGLGFAIPSDDALPIIKELIENKKIVRPYIGLAGINITSAVADRNNLREGVYVDKVYNNTPAQKAGIQRGDIIVSIDGVEITTMEELNEIKNSKNIGDTVELGIYRAGREEKVTIVLEADSNVEESTTN